MSGVASTGGGDVSGTVAPSVGGTTTGASGVSASPAVPSAPVSRAPGGTAFVTLVKSLSQLRVPSGFAMQTRPGWQSVASEHSPPWGLDEADLQAATRAMPQIAVVPRASQARDRIPVRYVRLRPDARRSDPRAVDRDTN